MGSPQNVDSNDGRTVMEALSPPMSSVDKSELFQVNGLNTTVTSGNETNHSRRAPLSVFDKKREPEKPKLIVNTVIKSIKVGGRSRMILRDSSLG